MMSASNGRSGISIETTVVGGLRSRIPSSVMARLIGSPVSGSVDLTMVGYDAGFNPVNLTPDAPLTLTTDNTSLALDQPTLVTAR